MIQDCIDLASNPAMAPVFAVLALFFIVAMSAAALNQRQE